MIRLHAPRVAKWVVVALVACWVEESHAELENPIDSGARNNAGAFTGLATAPEANLFLGAATTSIPIDVPPGRASMTPQLVLSYSSSSGPSPYGYGWDLSLGRVQRCGKHGVLSCSDPSFHDDYVIVLPSGAVECRLDPSSSSYPRRCIPFVEEKFLRIEISSSTNPHWDVWDAAGVHYTFGDVPQARVGSSQDSLFVPSSASTPCQYISAWGLSEIEDLNGNTIKFTYLAASGSDGTLYPDVVSYGANTNDARVSTLYSVIFRWRFLTDASQWTTRSIAGFPATIAKALDRIHVVGGNTDWIRSYFFDYVEADSTTPSPPMLASVSVAAGSPGCIPDEPTSDCHFLSRLDGGVVASTFVYQRDRYPAVAGFAEASQDKVIPTGFLSLMIKETVPQSLSYTDMRARIERMDLNGDGFTDLVETHGNAWMVHLGDETGFKFSGTWAASAAFCGGTRPGIRFTMYGAGSRWTFCDTIDMNGDGIPDFIKAWNPGEWKVYFGQLASTAGSEIGRFEEGPLWLGPGTISSFRWTQSVDYLGFGHGGHKAAADQIDLIDMNADGLPDLVDARDWTEASPYWRIWFNTGAGFDTGDGTQFYAPYQWLRYTTHSNLQILDLVDINGDGLPDQVMTWDRRGNAPYPGYWTVHLNEGYGMGPAQAWVVPASTCSQAGVASNGIRQAEHNGSSMLRDFLDITGDGLPDIVDTCGYSAATPNWSVYVNSGNDFARNPLSWPAPKNRIRVASSEQVESDVFDADGDGLLDYVVAGAQPAMHRIYRNRAGAWCASEDSETCASTSGVTVAPSPDAGRPQLLVEFENGIGSVTNLEYRPSTQWNPRSGGHSAPGMPFHLWTVTNITRDDGLKAPSASGVSHK